MGVACLEFHGENFHGWLKNREIRESFLPQKFPAIRYTLLLLDGYPFLNLSLCPASFPCQYVGFFPLDIVA